MTTYYVRSSGGNDANDGLSFANAFATIQKAADTATAGDDVRICADGIHVQTATIDLDTNSGTGENPIVFTGANATTGADDGTVAAVNRTSFGDHVFKGNGTVAHIYFKNLSSENISRAFCSSIPHALLENITCAGATTYVAQSCSGSVLINCALSGTAAIGLSLGNQSDGETHIDCYVDMTASSSSSPVLTCSSFRNSTSYKRVSVKGAILGATFNNSDVETSGILDSCIFDGCTTGVSVQQDDTARIIGCTFYDCTTGIDSSAAGATGNLFVENSIFKDCTEAIELGATVRTNLIDRRNVFYGNTRNVSSDTTELGIHASSVTTDPSFSDAANGDFTVTEATLIQRSLAWEDGNNTSYLDAGAIQSEVTAGGSGLIIEPPIQIGL